MTILERLGAHAVSGYRRGLTGPARDALRLHIADTVGAWVAASKTAEAKALELAKQFPVSHFLGGRFLAQERARARR